MIWVWNEGGFRTPRMGRGGSAGCLSRSSGQGSVRGKEKLGAGREGH